ncbi:MAG: hypothetical protein ABSD74_05620 [Rhizomicrobium sp.]|jgi:hypothetical protein
MTEAEIIIAGRPWRVPLLAPRQNRIIVPLIVARDLSYSFMLEIAITALTRAYPDLDRAAVEDWPIPLYELRTAVPVIAQQTGMIAAATRDQPRSSSGPPDCDAIIAEFCNFLPGTTPDYWEDALTWRRYEAQQEEWRRHPPVAVLVAGYLGYKPKSRDLDAVSELMRLFPTGRLRLN